MGKVRLAFLGPPSIERDGAAVHFDTRKAVALMAYLCVIGKPVSRDTLVTMLWPRYGRSEGHAALRRTLSTLRSTLGHECINAERETVCLPERAGIWIDLVRFRELLTLLAGHPHGATSICRRCLPVLTEAAGLYRGQFLLGFTLKDSVDFDDWQFFTTEKYRLEAVQVLDRLAVCSAAGRDFRSAVGYAHERLELDRLDESAHVLLMQLFAWEGNRAAAKHQFDECRRLMEKELQSPPQAATVRLAESIAHGQVPELPVFVDEPGEEAERPRRAKRNVGTTSAAAAHPIVPTAAAAPPAERRSTIRRIAVLPFTNISPDPNDEYFADGLTEELISAVSKIGGLRTISRTSAMRFKSSGKTLTEIAAELQVGALVEGSVRKAGTHVRISLQLVDVQSDEHLWSQDYDRELEDIFAIQSDIARKVAQALQVHIQAPEWQGIDKRATGSIESYDEYLKGVYYSRRRTKVDLDLASMHFEKALSLDVKNARAHAALAFAERFKHSFGLDRRSSVLEKAESHLAQALALDPQSEEVLLIQALFLRDRGLLTETIGILRHLLAASPFNSQANAYMGNVYRDTGEMRKAIEYHTRAMVLDPLDYFLVYNVLSDYFAMGAKEKIPALLTQLELIQPDHFMTMFLKGQSRAAEGDERAALEIIDASVHADPAHVDSYAVRALYSLYFGRHDEAYRDVRYLLDHSEIRPFMLKNCMIVLFCLRKFDDLLMLIDAALKTGAATVSRGTDLTAMALLYRGILLRSQNLSEIALQSLMQARSVSSRTLEQYPDSPSLRSFHALILAACGDHEEAIQQSDQAIRNDPDCSQCWYDRARICAMRGEREGVLASLRKALEHAVGEQGALRNEITFRAFAEDTEFLALVDPVRRRNELSTASATELGASGSSNSGHN